MPIIIAVQTHLIRINHVIIIPHRQFLVRHPLNLGVRKSGGRLYRDGIVANEQVLSKIKNGWQKPQKKSIEMLCKKYNINAAWLYTVSIPKDIIVEIYKVVGNYRRQ